MGIWLYRSVWKNTRNRGSAMGKKNKPERERESRHHHISIIQTSSSSMISDKSRPKKRGLKEEERGKSRPRGKKKERPEKLLCEKQQVWQKDRHKMRSR